MPRIQNPRRTRTLHWQFGHLKYKPTSIQLAGYELESGMYIYALITDGPVIGTKKMILTK